jgi:Cof subfamily protein (haloacid dehalogenase superfamily)
MPIRLVAIDLDGTLLNSRSELSPANLEALREAQERGVHVVVVTGRRFYSARRILEQLPFPVMLIASNGAMIGASSGEVLHQNFLPRATARVVLKLALDYRPYAVAIFDTPGRGQVVMQEGAAADSPLEWYLATSPEVLRLLPDLMAALDRDPVQLMFGGPPGYLEPIEPMLLNSPAGAHIHATWTKYLTRNLSIFDVMNRGCSKGQALAFLAGELGIKARDVMAIGDNFNDLEMLEFAGQPVVMGNRTPGFGQASWPITLSNDQDGVAAALESFLFR